jgi:hypothetical protein
MPRYWTAAKMLLLQLDMLAYAKGSIDEVTVVIGAGIPAAWLNRPLRVQGVILPEGRLDWSWDGKHMRVKMAAKKKVNVQLGQAFLADTPLDIEYL